MDAKNPLNRHGVNRAQDIRKFHLKISEMTTRGARKLKHYVYGPFQSFFEILESKLKNKFKNYKISNEKRILPNSFQKSSENFRTTTEKLQSEAYHIRINRPDLNDQTESRKYFKLF